MRMRTLLEDTRTRFEVDRVRVCCPVLFRIILYHERDLELVQA